jgi:hypothetical protein
MEVCESYTAAITSPSLLQTNEVGSTP